MDKTTQAWFDPATVTVVRVPGLNDWHTDEELVRLSGAPRDSMLKVSITEEGAIELRVVNHDLLGEDMVRVLVQESDGYAFHIVNAAFVLNDALLSKGIGPRSICLELEQARQLGYITRIKTHAVGDWASFDTNPPYRGYYVWPRMGFTAPVPSALLQHPELPQGMGDNPTLLDLLASDDGDAFWLKHGETIKVEFDLSDGSASWKMYARYIEERNIEVQP